ncbi:NFX1-type zinc finger-containing protein 1-like [Schistocerca cancellata]|uniref:NFX1-type zinc finger-containing protein 1-like n=1 Tax=Schistocerca cancellata TaxID=274614 RepID=UPI002119A8E8|nr:NFX1-type zinc finger-containing protein 1-like [Schistocerca cancellata]XP_049773524.1 NFX1-type zinc finger-containing protein 1-like [Schistocerca cancellata]
MAESLSDKLFSVLDAANMESRTRTERRRHQSVPRKKFELNGRRQEEQDTQSPFSSSLSSTTRTEKQGNNKKTGSNVDISVSHRLPSKHKNVGVPQHFAARSKHPGNSSHFFSHDSNERGNVRWSSRDRLTNSTRADCEASVQHSNDKSVAARGRYKMGAHADQSYETTSRFVRDKSQVEDRQKSSTSIKGTGYKFLENLIDKDPVDVVVKLASSKTGFDEMLKKEMFPDLIHLTLRILAEKVCVVGFQHNKTTVLIAACQPHFLNQLERQINKIPTEHQSRKSKILPFLENLLIFYKTVINVLPQTACEKFNNLFIMTELSIEGAQRYQNINCDDVKKQLEDLSAQLKSKREEYERNSIKESSKMEQLQYLQPPDNFRHYSIFPTAEDFANKPFLRPSIIKGAYIDVEHYLDVQFRLLREDFVGPLREGISQYMEHCLQGKKKFKRIDNVRMYHDAQFLNTVTVKEKVGVLLNFDTKRKLKNIQWEHSKRFMFGSLLCFTQDNFGTFFFGTVLDRDKKQLEKGCVVVELSDEIDTNIFDRTFTVAESEVYFEPYRQVLNALQTMPFTEFPMKPYIVDGITEVGLPLYILANPVSVIYNIDDFGVPVTEMNAWPTEDDLNLDISQYKSFRSALTKEFVIIQGPPGTGKTFLGLKIMETFLYNQNVWNSNHRPILVVCYTNHALDQVLEGTLQYTTKIIRIGGQSQSKALEPYNLKEVRRSRGVRASTSHTREMFRQMQDVINHIHSLQRDLDKMSDNWGVVSISSLKEMGLTEKQLASFIDKQSVSDELFIEWLKGDGNDNPDNELQQGGDDACNTTNLDDLHNVDGDNVGAEDDDDDDNNINVFSDEYDLVIQTVSTVQLKYAVELSRLLADSQYCQEQMERSRDNPEDFVKFQQLWLYNMGLYRFFKSRLTQVVNIDGRVVERLTRAYNLWELNIEERWYLYKYWCHCLHLTLMKRVWHLQSEYKQLCMRYDEIRDIEDLNIMQDALVVGMTTSGAARKQPLLQELKPRIVIVEEAAEVLESHVVVSLTKACEHLILIGDHKQLRPSTAVFELAKKYNFDVSLFERMLQNGMQYDCLEVQHRMRPEIANLITPTIYPTLKSAPSVYQYEKVKGVTKNLFFINHRFHEEEVSETVSRRNLFEAEFLIALCRYLLLQGYEESEITILTTYSGQMFYLRKLKRESGALPNVRITVVDNFQGEENKIILLSLVRSNEDANIGFLKVENRVCVALSRAKEGFYIIGNMENLIRSSKIWPQINETLVKQDAIGSHLTLKCQVHPSEETKVASAADFKAVPEGGCSLPCEAELTCGHKCQSVCHVKNRFHENYKCYFPCERIPQQCPLGHKCLKKCFQECGDCETPMERELPCKHVKTLACHMDVNKYRCKEVVEAVLEPCNHKVNKLCFQDVKSVHCSFPCEDRLLCGHSCVRNCHAADDPDHLEYKCNKPCEKNNAGCKRNHKCNKKCYEECGDCVVEIKVQLNCGHTHQIRCSSDPSEVKCGRDCKRTMECGHKCRLLCFQPCGNCPVKVQKVIPECGHEVVVPCCKQPSRNMCRKTCERLLPCGHRCKSMCCNPCTSQCEELVPSRIRPACGHAVEIPCYLRSKELSPYSTKLLSRCEMPCRKVLQCEHVCEGTCGACHQGRLHLPCQQKCGRVQICGHSCNVDCAKNCPPCNQKCEYRCRHSRCSLRCGVPCTPCREPCEWRCEHSRCTKLCYELCNRSPCYEPCEKKLKCGHDCVGFCGEPCPPLCRICDEDELTTIVFGSEDEEGARFVYLEDCKHTVESKALDEWLKQQSVEICLRSCPLCKTPIKRSLRFLNYLKISYNDIQNIKEKVFGNPQDNNAKRIQLNITLKKIVLPDIVRRESSEIQKILTLLQSNLQNVQGKRRIFLSKTDLDSLSIKIEFVSKLLETVKLFHKALNGEPCKKLMKQFDRLVYLMRTRNINMSQQEVNDFNLEVSRFMRAAQFRSIESSDDFKASRSNDVIKDLHKKALQVVKSIESYTPANDQKLKEILDKLNKQLKAVAPLDIETIRREIVKAVGLTPGHWYKCPNGHYYAIGECGGAMEVGKCPDCGARIGGSSHRLLDDNRHAGELDGSTRPAWG